jgi:alpha-mannosidase
MTVANRGNPGHSILGKRILVSLLRSGTLKGSAFKPPIGSYENGRRVFEFTLYPHSGSWTAANAHRMGIEWNNPLHATWEKPHAGALPASLSFLRVEGVASVVCSALKQSEDGEDLIVRLYETAGQRADIRLDTPGVCSEVVETDLRERGGTEVCSDALTLQPFEIKTLRVRQAAVRT